MDPGCRPEGEAAALEAEQAAEAEAQEEDLRAEAGRMPCRQLHPRELAEMETSS